MYQNRATITEKKGKDLKANNSLELFHLRFRFTPTQMRKTKKKRANTHMDNSAYAKMFVGS